MKYRNDEHHDLPDASAWNAAVVTRRKNAEKAVLRDIANELERQDALAEPELDALLKTDFNAYWQRKSELERSDRHGA